MSNKRYIDPTQRDMDDLTNDNNDTPIDFIYEDADVHSVEISELYSISSTYKQHSIPLFIIRHIVHLSFTKTIN